MDRLALVQRFELRERFSIAFDELGEFQQDPLAIGRAQPAPYARIERALRARDCTVDVVLVGIGDGREPLAGGRVVHVESRSRVRALHCAVDE